MNDNIRISEFRVQLAGNMWETSNDENKYHFLPIEVKESDNNKNPYELHIIDKKTNKFTFEIYYMSLNADSCYVEFLGSKYKILHINNSVTPHKMDLENEKGSIISFFG